MAKWHDGAQQVTGEDVPAFADGRLRRLAAAGRLRRLGIGAGRRLRR
jgi:hypothetical protein